MLYSYCAKNNTTFLVKQEQIGSMARNLKALVTKNSFKERYKTAQTYLQKLKFLVEDVSRGPGGVFLIQLDSQRARLAPQ